MADKRWKEVGFERWNELGFRTDRVMLNHKTKTIEPFYDLDELLGRGFIPRGAKVVFTDQGGYDNDRARIKSFGISEGDVLTVEGCSIGDWRSSYKFEEVPGHHNTVMFEVYKNPNS